LTGKNNWKKEVSFFTKQVIADSDKLLDDYLSALKKSKNEIEIWEAIETIVKGFDELNIKHD